MTLTCWRPRCDRPIVGNTRRQFVSLCAEHAAEHHTFWRQYHADVLDDIARKAAVLPGQMELM